MPMNTKAFGNNFWPPTKRYFSDRRHPNLGFASEAKHKTPKHCQESINEVPVACSCCTAFALFCCILPSSWTSLSRKALLYCSSLALKSLQLVSINPLISIRSSILATICPTLSLSYPLRLPVCSSELPILLVTRPGSVAAPPRYSTLVSRSCFRKMRSLCLCFKQALF